MIEIKNISFKYSGGPQVLSNVNISIPAGHIYAILGESGSGKTTLLKCIGRFLQPRSGSITLKGRNIYEIEEREFRKSVSIVFQQLFLFPHLNILQNMILAPMKVLGKNERTAREEAVAMLETLGIASLKDSYPAAISGGQAQRATIARSLMLKPEYLLLDEPTSALDVNTSDEFGKWLTDLKEYTTFVVVTHDILFVNKIASFGALMEKGTVREESDIGNIIKKHFPAYQYIMNG